MCVDVTYYAKYYTTSYQEGTWVSVDFGIHGAVLEPILYGYWGMTVLVNPDGVNSSFSKIESDFKTLKNKTKFKKLQECVYNIIFPTMDPEVLIHSTNLTSTCEAPCWRRGDLCKKGTEGHPVPKGLVYGRKKLHILSGTDKVTEWSWGRKWLWPGEPQRLSEVACEHGSEWQTGSLRPTSFT